MKTTAAILLAVILAAHASAQKADPPPGVAVEPRDTVVITGIGPIPEVGKGAPYFGAKDMGVLKRSMGDEIAEARNDSAACAEQRRSDPQARQAGRISAIVLLNEKIDAATRVSMLANTVAKATDAAEAVRRELAAGKASARQVEKAELERQGSVDRLLRARAALTEADAALADFKAIRTTGRYPDRGQLDELAARRRKMGWGQGIAKPIKLPGLSIGDVRVQHFTDPEVGEFLRLMAHVTNVGDRDQLIPPITAALFDARGLLLEQHTGRAGGGGKITERATGQMTQAYILRADHEQTVFFDIKDAPEHVERASLFFGSAADPPRTGTMTLACRAMGPGDREPTNENQ